MTHLLTPKKSTLVGTWNVRTMFQTGYQWLLPLPKKWCATTSLSWAWEKEDGHSRGEVKLPSGQTVIFSGHEEDGANHTEGVAIMMTKETKKGPDRMGTHQLSPHHCILQNQQQGE
ncbi:hypothetical protein NHX12_014904 [Muraenolepis orangiensis]|uniref:Uncharacterized protein n=1 Tax=Muraenolepis orangiensis TaxID=630683 RepID=A0A9Q0I3E0_9TELE|nr:hypothetical protein NHX12_014904 [Muraenolepis orangiensis]